MPLMWANMIQAGLPGRQHAAPTSQIARRRSSSRSRSATRSSCASPSASSAAITPWNYPLHQIVAKVAPALAAGCTVVLKPSEVAPLNAFILAEVIDEVGLPAGVFNLVTGTGPVVGEAIAAHPDVDMVSLHRLHPGRQAGRRAGRARPSSGSPSSSAASRPTSSSTTPTSPTVVPERRVRLLPELRPDLHRADPHARAPRPARRGRRASPRPRPRASRSATRRPGRRTLGPLVSAAQRDRVRGYIQKGIDEGATLVTGGAERARGPRHRLLRAARRCSPTSPTT